MSTEREPAQYIVLDVHDNAFGPFDSATGAAEWAAKKWPDIEEREALAGYGWEVRPLTSPDEGE